MKNNPLNKHFYSLLKHQANLCSLWFYMLVQNVLFTHLFKKNKVLCEIVENNFPEEYTSFSLKYEEVAVMTRQIYICLIK